MLRIGFICPVFDAVNFDNYTRLALRSFFDTTPGGVAIVVDDGSKSWNGQYEASLYEIEDDYPKHNNIYFHNFQDNGGLTRSWNKGLSIAQALELDYAIAGNNDIIFTHSWSSGMVHALANGYSMVGPLSNAPGITANGKQEVNKYVTSYELTDNRDLIDQVAAGLYHRNLGKIVESPINGFFQMAKMEAWRKGKFDKQHYYRPVNTYTSKGRLNPTPLMTLNEDELQGRWTRKGMKSAIAISSFIFHYRAVSRGDNYKRGKWYRQT
jgi:glycosyltransferase involved in cell wall biosynthesis